MMIRPLAAALRHAGRCLLMMVLALALTARPALAQSVLRDAETEQFLQDIAKPLVAAAGLQPGNVQIILLCVMWSKARSAVHFADIARLSAAHPSADVILLSDIEDLNDILKAIESGARGYVPTSVSLEVAVKAMQLVAAGGVYIPASVLFWSDKIIKEISQSTKQKQQPDTIFTSRQSSVMEALRRGKANKIIAYELNMCESTVKVHIRNIMKKLKAKNRTEVAYILNNMILDENNVVRN